ncbi:MULTISPECIES: hypothetical protein [Brevibacterium]|uniref:Uncharacterized protein n=1 Tax=Brevibacterium casei TaxID=33889 RepID=A0A269ZBI3_9MICO|nr:MULTISPECIES: hypothetical protein [Brevibacterium]NJE65451.1 hypothetical protein [Brevibacterium sp. LS14]MCM1014279.1 hypothetical protein [Brevibacterium sp. XM4083]MCT1550709.1 hypothetical protein [Brevibacterium casei]MCT1559961.1 hypothetical protein [Brevibacterium casei]MCT2206812.1 hypothetical protein [Brevibacterium casei]
MGRLALIPSAPVLLPDVDLSETESVAEVRAGIRATLTSADRWALPVDMLPTLLGLGGFGIDRGIDTRTGKRLDGADWVEAATELDEAEREHCVTAHPGLSVASLHAHDAGVTIGPLGSSDDILIPIDLSAAASADSPLAPVAGAREFDTAVVDAVRAGDLERLRDLVGKAAAVHADLDLLGRALGTTTTTSRHRTTIIVDTTVHDVRTLCAEIEY